MEQLPSPFPLQQSHHSQGSQGYPSHPTPPRMSHFALPLPLISLFFFSGFAVAGISAPGCSSTSTWEWSFNSLGQNACTVAAYMLSTCNAGSFTLPLPPPGYYFGGPSAAAGTDLCLCNTIVYSLLSACDGCLGLNWTSWPDYVTNCTTILPPGSFPNRIPAGTSLQRWAILDITIGNTWDANQSRTVGDNPELGPGTILDPAGPVLSSSIGPTSSTITTSSLSPTAGSSSSITTSTPGPVGYRVRGHSSNTGAIAGGTIAAVAAISIIVALLFYRKRLLAQAQPTPTGDRLTGANVFQDPPRPTSGQETITSTVPRTSSSLLRPYNPADPTTFPGYQAPSNLSFTSAQPPSSSSTRHLYTVATPPRPKAPETRG